MEGANDGQVDAGSPAPAKPLGVEAAVQEVAATSSSPAVVVSQDKNKPESDESDESSGDDDPEAFERMRRDTAKIATEVLQFYNQKEGTNFVVRQPLMSLCNLFAGTLVIHANFTAKNVVEVDPAVSENNTPSEQLFFSETLTAYGHPRQVLNCLIIDKSKPDIRRGCVYCPSHMCNITFFHPPMGNSEFGEDEEKDNAKFDYDDWTSSSSGSDDEEAE